MSLVSLLDLEDRVDIDPAQRLITPLHAAVRRVRRAGRRPPPRRLAQESVELLELERAGDPLAPEHLVEDRPEERRRGRAVPPQAGEARLPSLLGRRAQQAQRVPPPEQRARVGAGRQQDRRRSLRRHQGARQRLSELVAHAARRQAGVTLLDPKLRHGQPAQGGDQPRRRASQLRRRGGRRGSRRGGRRVGRRGGELVERLAQQVEPSRKDVL
mmetsp:Transcript_42393/g.136878  ORF Transcript_42393/g.136878 Transcript_42393/m.136878 type:complete len:214 (-) Transcript_42393:918-1559(-)